MRTKTTLALAIWVGMTAVASAQQASGDRGVQRTAANTGGTAAAAAPATNGPTPGLPAVIGSIDMDSEPILISPLTSASSSSML